MIWEAVYCGFHWILVPFFRHPNCRYYSEFGLLIFVCMFGPLFSVVQCLCISQFECTKVWHYSGSACLLAQTCSGCCYHCWLYLFGRKGLARDTERLRKEEKKRTKILFSFSGVCLSHSPFRVYPWILVSDSVWLCISHQIQWAKWETKWNEWEIERKIFGTYFKNRSYRTRCGITINSKYNITTVYQLCIRKHRSIKPTLAQNGHRIG